MSDKYDGMLDFDLLDGTTIKVDHYEIDNLYYMTSDFIPKVKFKGIGYLTKGDSHRLVPGIKKVIFNDPATIVFWNDDTKTVVKCGELDTFDPEKGLAMAIAKKALGNKGNYYNTIKKRVPEEDISEPFSKLIAIFNTMANA